MRDAREFALATLCQAPASSALLSDFDGTLAMIVTEAPRAVALAGVPELLGRLACRLGVVAVVSGRPAAFLVDRLGSREGLELFGLYGLEHVEHTGATALTVEAEDDPQRVADAAASARELLPPEVVEDKGHSLTLHWRPDPSLEASVRNLAALLAARSGMVLREGKASVELVARAAPDKGLVVRLLGASRSCVAFAGDDLGDLAAFAALDELALHGARTLRIAIGGSEAPAELLERADLICRDPPDWRDFLAELARRLEEAAGAQN